jgi:hypothetical protein
MSMSRKLQPEAPFDKDGRIIVSERYNEDSDVVECYEPPEGHAMFVQSKCDQAGGE